MSDSTAKPYVFRRDKVAYTLNNIRDWMGEDTDNIVFRRFEKLGIYNLLRLQRELTTIESEMDQILEKGTEDDMDRFDALMGQARELLASYYEGFLKYQRMRNLPYTPEYVIKAIESSDYLARCWIREQHDILEHVKDLSSIVATEKGPVHQFIDSKSSLTSLLSRAQHYGEQKKQSTSSSYYYSERVLWYFDQLIMNCLVVGLVGVPIVILSFVPTIAGKLAAVLGFIVIAAPITSLISSSYQKHNNVPLMLAYASILVAFLSQTSNSPLHV